MVLHVVTDSDRRGAQIFAVDLCEALAGMGRGGSVVALRPGSGGATLDLPVLQSGKGRLASLSSLRSAMRSAEVVVAHGSHTLRWCAMAGLGLEVPVVYRNISDPQFWTSTWQRRLRVRLLLRRMDHVVSLYQGGKRYLHTRLGVAEERITTIPNAVRVSLFRPPTVQERDEARARFGLPEDAVVLLYVAALQPEKHPVTAVEALGSLRPDTYLLMLGEGSERKRIESVAADLAPGRVIAPGRVGGMQQAYWASDVAVLPSEGEGLPAALIEAGLSGLPCVASVSGGNADIVLDGVTGRLVPWADAEALAAAVTETLEHRVSWGRAARDHCRREFDLGHVVRRWDEVLGGVSQRPKRRP
jgi:glycosyltransferase involved in cell wall biosynthesis